ncbi:MAG: NADH-quinone oxidoreductase subunit J [Bacteroidales bacterium]
MTALPTVTVITVAATLVCAICAVRAARLLVSALWLAGTSAAVSLLMYMLGAPEVAVIELSVGAGLVTVLFVFAINIAGDEPLPARSRVPRLVAWVVTLGSLALLAVFALPRVGIALPVPGAERFATALWEYRAADVLLQVALMFTGVLGVIGLLSDEPVGPRSLEESGELRQDAKEEWV